MLKDVEFKINNSRIKAFAENKKIYKIILGMMFVFSSVCYSAIVADACRDIKSSDTKILFLNMLWIVLYIIAAIIYIAFVEYSPLTFAISTYFVVDYTIGSLFSAIYDVHFLPVTNIIRYAFVIAIMFLYLWLKWLYKKGYVVGNFKFKSFKYSFLSIWCDLFFPAAGAIIAEIALIANYLINDSFLKIIIIIVTIVLLLISVIILGAHFAHGNTMFYTLCTMVLTIGTYLFVAVGIFDGTSDVSISFWYALFDALNLIS